MSTDTRLNEKECSAIEGIHMATVKTISEHSHRTRTICNELNKGLITLDEAIFLENESGLTRLSEEAAIKKQYYRLMHIYEDRTGKMLAPLEDI